MLNEDWGQNGSLISFLNKRGNANRVLLNEALSTLETKKKKFKSNSTIKLTNPTSIGGKDTFRKSNHILNFKQLVNYIC